MSIYLGLCGPWLQTHVGAQTEISLLMCTHMHTFTESNKVFMEQGKMKKSPNGTEING